MLRMLSDSLVPRTVALRKEPIIKGYGRGLRRGQVEGERKSAEKK